MYGSPSTSPSDTDRSKAQHTPSVHGRARRNESCYDTDESIRLSSHASYSTGIAPIEMLPIEKLARYITSGKRGFQLVLHLESEAVESLFALSLALSPSAV